MEQNRKLRNKLHNYGLLIFNTGARIYNREKTVSSGSGVGKVSGMCINEVRTHLYTIHKDKLKMA